MSESILVLGESGSGKSYALRNLNPETTFLINVIGKNLPFKGYKKKFTSIEDINDENFDFKKGNLFISDNAMEIWKCYKIVDKRTEIKTLIIDDFQYIIANEFMRRAKESGYGKFSEMGSKSWSLINQSFKLRDDLIVFFLNHSDIDEFGKARCKTIGKLLSEKITIEGMFTTVLHSVVNDDGYWFMTQSDGRHVAKSPVDMFQDKLIPNDLALVVDAIRKYEEE